jgi:outer membrane protein OmpA-like peptidoglycan-associated protein
MGNFSHLGRLTLDRLHPRGFERRSRLRSGRKLRSWKLVAALATAGSCLLLAWALFWPEGACTEPLCARARFSVSVEIDAFRQVPPIPLEITQPARASLREALRAGGIEVSATFDQLELPYDATSGPLDQADLYQFARAWRSRTDSTSDAASIYALIAPGLVSDGGVPLFGLMFDTEGREGFAVAPATTAAYFGKREPGSVAMLQLRTFAHELLHALNRDHLDAAQMVDGRLTLEAPTRCIAEQQQTQWFLNEAPLMAISPSTIYFFQAAATRDVLPGKGHSAFALGRTSPTECRDARETMHAYPAATRWEYARRRLQQLFSIGTANAAQEAATVDTAQRTVELRIQTLPASYPLGYPVAVRLQVRNRSEISLPLRGRLHPGYGLVSIESRRAGTSPWQALQPSVRFEPVEDDQAMLAPGALTEATVPVYFSEAGWTFRSPGNYEVRARLLVGADAPEVISASTSVRVSAPTTDDDRAALQPFLDRSGQLDDDIGRLLAFGGRIGSPSTLAALESTVRDYGQTALGSALRLTLSSERLRRPMNPLTGERPAPDLSGARGLLEDVCTDSGVAALKQELLQRYPGVLSATPSSRVETPATAWDGMLPQQGATLPTYSDPSLQVWETSLHFCFNSTRLSSPARTALRGLAQQLRRDGSTRVVVVGHGDDTGNCRYNDALALRRAQAVKRALIRAGLRNVPVQVAGLGERRPLDFASSETARNLNRRVELLVQRADPRPIASTQRVLPKCR